MIFKEIHEPIDVLVAFRKDAPKPPEVATAVAKPMTFKWGKSYYQVEGIHLVHSERRGREKIYIFSVSSGALVYRLSFSTESLVWKLEEVCEDGA
jgi:hypothetical protein